MWPGRVGILAGDDRPSWIVGHSWRNTLFALARKGLVQEHIERNLYGASPFHTEFTITDAGRQALGGSAREHCRRVANAFEPGSDAERVALFHDHIEDGVDEPVPAEILEHVKVLSRRSGEVYADYIARIKASGDPIAIAVKIADLRDNLARCRGEHGGHIKPHLAPRYERALVELDAVVA